MLVDFLRREIHLTGTKVGCNAGGCGACTVMLTEPGVGGRHRPVLSCLTPLALAHNCHVTTIEGVAHGAEGCGADSPPGQLHPIQRQFAEGHASQCGFCTPVSETRQVNECCTAYCRPWASLAWVLNLSTGSCRHRARLCRSTRCCLESPTAQLPSISSRPWQAICAGAQDTVPSSTLPRPSQAIPTASRKLSRGFAALGQHGSRHQQARQIRARLTSTVVGTRHLSSRRCALRR